MDIIIEQTDAWQITSHGNGAAYTITRKRDGATCFVQYGDEATRWRGEYDDMTIAYSDMSSAWHKVNWNGCLAHLWDMAGGTND